VKAVLTHLIGGKRGVQEVFSAGTISLGRDSSNDLIFSSHDTKVSARHAEIKFRNDASRVRDLNSTNGTFINGQRITESDLNDGDIIEFGLGGPRIKLEFDRSDDLTHRIDDQTNRLQIPATG